LICEVEQEVTGLLYITANINPCIQIPNNKTVDNHIKHISIYHVQEKSNTFVFPYIFHPCLQCFDAVGWVAGRASGL